MPTFTKNSLWKPFWITLLLGTLLGYAQIADKLPVAFLCLIALFIIFKSTLGYPLKKRLLTVFATTTVYMTTVTSWFRNIEAFGWQDIAHLPPQFWLVSAVLVVSALCALCATAVFYLAYRIIDTLKIGDMSIRVAYLWAVSMMLLELTLSTAFSFATRPDGAPVEPTWNMYSLALLTATNIFSSVSRFTGVWGTSFVLYMFVSLLGLALMYALRRRVHAKTTMSLGLLTLLVLIAILVPAPSRPGSPLRVMAVSEPTSDNNYLEDLKQTIKSDIAGGSDATRLVVLPEYSKLLSPYANSSMLTFNYDARYTYPETFSGTATYFVGTEDQYHDGKRYAETYLVNGSLEKIKRKPKTFLIPGGEYVIGWVGSILSAVSKDSSALLQGTRVRSVIRNLPAPTTTALAAQPVSIHACSSLLVPYDFRDEAKRGAGLFAVNVSYEQFKKAPEYMQFADRFARLTAKATNRPLAIGAFGGQAVIYDKNGRPLVTSSNGATLAVADISTEYANTPYVHLGDAFIITVFSGPFLLGVAILGKQKLKKSGSSHKL